MSILSRKRLRVRRKGETCPECKNEKLAFDAGHNQTRDEPAEPPAIYCPDCGEHFPIDFPATERYELAERIARDLFTNGNGQHGTRLVMVGDSDSLGGLPDLGGWCEGAVVDRVFQLLGGSGRHEPGSKTIP